MKRTWLLLVLVILVAWLAHGSAVRVNSKPGPEPSSRVPAAMADCSSGQSCCLNEGETDPHWECINGACSCQLGCGVSVDCANCGCDPNDEWACVYSGGYWDSYFCTCDYSFDPDGSQQNYCYSIGGTWDPATCNCDPPPCNPGPEEVSYEDSWDCAKCDGNYYDWCWCTYRVYTRYCQDGSVYSQRDQNSKVCSPQYDPD